MNSKKIILLSSSAIFVILFTTLSYNLYNKPERLYQPRESNSNTTSLQPDFDFFYKRKANQITGKIDPNAIKAVEKSLKSIARNPTKTAIGLNWEFVGPDNIGGRTRSFIIDKNNPNLFITGGVQGGIFISKNKGISWEPIKSSDIEININVSAITQTENGRIFFVTGSTAETASGTGGSGGLGGGLYELDIATETITAIVSSTQKPNNSTSDVAGGFNHIASDGNRLYLATWRGAKYADLANGGYPNDLSNWTNLLSSRRVSNIGYIDVASNGSVIVSLGNEIWRNDAKDGTFTRIKNFSSSSISQRIKAKAAPSDNNIIYFISAASNSCLNEIGVSLDKGANWSTLATGTRRVAKVGEFDPLSNVGTNCQGLYDLALAINPSDPYHIILGGTSLHSWKASKSNPLAGNFVRAALSYSIGNSYVHADMHNLEWVDATTVYVSTDGGIFEGKLQTDNTFTWTGLNFGLNITQFYDIGFSIDGLFVTGGAQDNGSYIIPTTTEDRTKLGIGTPKGGVTAGGGDGFATEIASFTSPQIAFTSVYNGNIKKASFGSTLASFWDKELNGLCENGCGSFYTTFELWETNNAIRPGDTIAYKFPVAKTFKAMDTLKYTSNSGYPLNHIFTAPASFAENELFRIPDKVEAKLVFSLQSGTGAGLWMTRLATKSNLPIDWSKIADATNSKPDRFTGQCFALAFSKDGNHLFAGTSSGSIYRISNLTNAINDATADVTQTTHVVTCTRLGNFSGRHITGVTVDPKDANNIIVTLGNYSNNTYVYRSTTALTATTSSNTSNFSSIQGPTSSSSTGFLPRMPVYDAVISYNDKNNVIIGTEYGVFSSTDAFTANSANVKWYDESLNGEMAHTPVFKVAQNYHPFSLAGYASGLYYLGTHGRGIFKSNPKKSITTTTANTKGGGNNAFSDLIVYPNPVKNSNGNISFTSYKNSENVAITIFDINGRIVKVKNIGTHAFGKVTTSLDLEGIENGLYIVKVTNHNESIHTKLIISK